MNLGDIGLELISHSPKPGDILFVSVHSDSYDADMFDRIKAEVMKGANGASVVVLALPKDERLDVRLMKSYISRKMLVNMGRCPECMAVGHWTTMACVCPEHGPFIG